MRSGDGDAGHRSVLPCPIDGGVDARFGVFRRARADGPQGDRVGMAEQIVAPRLCIAVADHLIVLHEPQGHTAAVAHPVPLGGLVEAHRVVSLVGAVGVGKTRLALAVARMAVRDFPDGIWLVEAEKAMRSCPYCSPSRAAAPAMASSSLR